MYRACIDVCDRGAIGWQLPVRLLFTVTNGQTVRHSSDEAMLKGQISQTSPPPTTTPHIHLLLVTPLPATTKHSICDLGHLHIDMSPDLDLHDSHYETHH